MDYSAPYFLPEGQPPVPLTGEFLLPVCTTRDRLEKMLNALNAYRNLAQDGDLDFMIDVLRALAFVDPECGPCECYDDQNIEILPTSDIITWNPNNPFDTPPGTQIAGYNAPPWLTGDDYIDNLLTPVPTDAIAVPRPDFDPLDLINGLITVGLPRFRVRFSGTGVIEIHLLQTIQGGYALITVDGDPLSADLVDTQFTSVGSLLDDVLSVIDTVLEGTITPVTIWEREITTPGDHYIDVTFIPNLDVTPDLNDLLTIGWGGGLRKIVLSGFDVEPPIVEFRQNPDNPCQLQQRRAFCDDWQTVFDYSLCEVQTVSSNDCCNDFLLQLQVNQVFNDIIDNSQTNITNYQQDPANWTPDMVYGDDGKNDFRDTAICWAITSILNDTWDVYIEDTESRINRDRFFQFVIAKVSTTIGVVVGATFGPIGAFSGGSVGMGIGLGIAKAVFGTEGLEQALEYMDDVQARQEVVCCAYETLIGNVSFQSWQNVADNLRGIGCQFDTVAAESLALSVVPIFTSLEVFVNVVKAMEESIKFVEQGQLDNGCLTCGQDEWCYTWLGGAGFSPAWTFNDFDGLATYDGAGDRVVGVKQVSQSGSSSVDMEIAANAIVTSIVFDVEYNNTRNTPNDRLKIIVNGETVNTLNVDTGVNQEQIAYSPSGGVQAGTIGGQFYAGYDTPGDAGYLYVTKITVRGVGVNPFGSDNC